MILGLGSDIFEVDRMRRRLEDQDDGFLHAVFTPREIARCRDGADVAARFAACFAIKEAVLKALAFTGARGSFWLDIETTCGRRGVEVVLHGRAARLAATHGAAGIEVAAGGDSRIAVATAVCHGVGEHAGADPGTG